MVMKKKPSNQPSYGLHPVVLASLPVLADWDLFRHGILPGCLVAVSLVLIAGFFRLTRSLLPKKLRIFSIILVLGAMAQTAWYHWKLGPLWTVGLFLLLPDGLFQKRPGRGFWRLVLSRAVLSGILLAGLGVLGSGSGGLRQDVLLQTPAGFLFLLAAAAVLIQPEGRSHA